MFCSSILKNIMGFHQQENFVLENTVFSHFTWLMFITLPIISDKKNVFHCHCHCHLFNIFGEKHNLLHLSNRIFAKWDNNWICSANIC